MSSAAVVTFTRQLADLLGGGLPLVRCIEITRTNAAAPGLRAALAAVLDDLNAGRPLSEALRCHERLFSPLYVGIVRSGESAGRLENAFETLAARLDADRELRQKFLNAALYPAIVLVMALAVCIFLTTFVIPRFGFLFEDLGQRLPWPTRLLIGISSGLRVHGPALLALIIGALVLFPAFPATWFAWCLGQAAKARPGRALLTAPFVARWSGTMSALVAAGFTVPDALALTRRSLGATPLAVHLERMEQSVAEGRDIAEAMRASARFPDVAIELVAAAQESGRLAEALNRLARVFEREADAGLRIALAAFEPALMAGLAVVVGFVALAMLLPIFEMSGGVR